ncbi:MAG: class I SAM-dependent methyltransferase [Acidimicrobiales bacterium]
MRGRYDRVAAFYDRAVVVERLFFPRARRRAVELLNLEPGETVVDVACGSGKNLALLHAAVGESGRVVGVDWSTNMLAAAHERVLRAGWLNVALLRADAAALSMDELRNGAILDDGDDIDAVICTFALSVIPRWQEAYRAMIGLPRDGGRVSELDVGYSAHRSPGEPIMYRALWRLACRITKAHGERQPWLRLGGITEAVEYFSKGYVAAGVGVIGAHSSGGGAGQVESAAAPSCA